MNKDSRGIFSSELMRKANQCSIQLSHEEVVDRSLTTCTMFFGWFFLPVEVLKFKMTTPNSSVQCIKL